jgi:hypothetical protein
MAGGDLVLHVTTDEQAETALHARPAQLQAREALVAGQLVDSSFADMYEHAGVAPEVDVSNRDILHRTVLSRARQSSRGGTWTSKVCGSPTSTSAPGCEQSRRACRTTAGLCSTASRPWCITYRAPPGSGTTA